MEQVAISEQASHGQADYRLAVRSSVRGLWAGVYDAFAFVDGMISAIERGFRRAWAEGAAAFGVTEDEMTPEELVKRETLINAEFQYLPAFADDIVAADRASGGKLQPLLNRAEVWANAYGRVVEEAKRTFGENQKMVWTYLEGDKEHCTDCSTYVGRVYRMSVWKRFAPAPKSRELACQGYMCGCGLVPTTDKCWPGHPPKAVGPGGRAHT